MDPHLESARFNEYLDLIQILPDAVSNLVEKARATREEAIACLQQATTEAQSCQTSVADIGALIATMKSSLTDSTSESHEMANALDAAFKHFAAETAKAVAALESRVNATIARADALEANLRNATQRFVEGHQALESEVTTLEQEAKSGSATLQRTFNNTVDQEMNALKQRTQTCQEALTREMEQLKAALEKARTTCEQEGDRRKQQMGDAAAAHEETVRSESERVMQAGQDLTRNNQVGVEQMQVAILEALQAVLSEAEASASRLRDRTGEANSARQILQPIIDQVGELTNIVEDLAGGVKALNPLSLVGGIFGL